MPGHFSQNGSKLKARLQYVVKNASSGEIIFCLLDTGSSQSIIPEHFIQKFNLLTKILKKALLIIKTQEMLNLQKVCVLLKLGHTQNMEMYVIENDLSYVLIWFPKCHMFRLNIVCVNNRITQNNTTILVMINNIDTVVPKTLHVSSEIHVNECNNDINVTQNIQSENDLLSEFRAMNNNYQTISESEINLTINESNFNSQNFNNSKLLALLAQYVKIF